MWPDNLSLQMTVLFLLMLGVLGYVMKLLALLLPTKGRIPRRSMSRVLASPDSVMRAQPVASVRAVVVRILMLLGALLLSYWLYWTMVRGFHLRGIATSYLAAPILLLMSEFLVAVSTLIFLPGGLLLPALHRRPWAARSVAEFWGDRWDLWFRDWFRYTIFVPLRRPQARIVPRLCVRSAQTTGCRHLPLPNFVAYATKFGFDPGPLFLPLQCGVGFTF